MGGGLMQMIQKMLGGMGGAAGGIGGIGGGGGSAGGMGGGGGGFNTGMMHGMLGGGGGGGGKGPASTKESDHAMGLSALQHYRDMSRPDYSGMNQFMNFAQMQNPGGPRIQQPVQPNMYVQALLSGMRGGR